LKNTETKELIAVNPAYLDIFPENQDIYYCADKNVIGVFDGSEYTGLIMPVDFPELTKTLKNIISCT